MPLSEAAPREQVHLRAIAINGYQRQDGLIDVEAHLTDSRAKGFTTPDRGHVPPSGFLHEMWARITIDENMHVVAAEASTEFGPLALCPSGARTFSRLAGLTIGPGFIKQAMTLLGGVEGCTHLRELLAQMATTAFQTLGPKRTTGEPNMGLSSKTGAPRLINSCAAFASDSPAVKLRWPKDYTGQDQAGSKA